MKKFLLTAVAAFAMVAPAQAAVLFSDNFNSYAPALNWNGSGTWTTGNSVDLVASSTFNLTCAGGTGNCVDLSASAPGFISRSLTLAAGIYQLSFDYTGNQLDAFGGPFTPASFTASVGSLVANIGPLANNSSSFASYSGIFTTTGPTTLTFSQNAGGDPFRGSILDNVVVASVPEPATWLMMIAGFGLVGGMMRRRKPAANLSFS
jgi:hypothetical protein